jgi:hypothetical protein
VSQDRTEETGANETELDRRNKISNERASQFRWLTHSGFRDNPGQTSKNQIRDNHGTNWRISDNSDIG